MASNKYMINIEFNFYLSLSTVLETFIIRTGNTNNKISINKKKNFLNHQNV